jgi:uncharacterized DUF497 family protein
MQVETMLKVALAASNLDCDKPYWTQRTFLPWRFTYDAEKRALILATRGLDFDDAVQVFAGKTLDIEDDRKDYGEVRWLTFGLLQGRLVAVVWTRRSEGRHIITMWKANDRERKKYEAQLE